MADKEAFVPDEPPKPDDQPVDTKNHTKNYTEPEMPKAPYNENDSDFTNLMINISYSLPPSYRSNELSDSWTVVSQYFMQIYQEYSLLWLSLGFGLIFGPIESVIGLSKSSFQALALIGET